MSKICDKCGATNYDSATICTRCGSLFKDGAYSVNSQRPNVGVTARQEKKNADNTAKVLIISVVSIVVIIVALVIILVTANKPKPVDDVQTTVAETSGGEAQSSNNSEMTSVSATLNQKYITGKYNLGPEEWGDYVPVDSVTVSQTEVYLYPGEQATIYAKTEPSNAYSHSVLWEPEEDNYENNIFEVIESGDDYCTIQANQVGDSLLWVVPEAWNDDEDVYTYVLVHVIDEDMDYEEAE